MYLDRTYMGLIVGRGNFYWTAISHAPPRHNFLTEQRAKNNAENHVPHQRNRTRSPVIDKNIAISLLSAKIELGKLPLFYLVTLHASKISKCTRNFCADETGPRPPQTLPLTLSSHVHVHDLNSGPNAAKAHREDAQFSFL